MRSNRHKINLHSFHIYTQFACTLRCVNMENNAVFARYFADCFDVVDHADFVVYMHQ